MTVRSHKLGPGKLTVTVSDPAGVEAELSPAMTSISIEPSNDDGDALPVLSGEEIAGDDKEGFTLTGNILQSYDRDSFQLFAHTHRGKVATFLFVPDNGREIGVKGRVRIRPLKIGGDVKTRNQSEVSWPGVDFYDYVDPETEDAIVWAPIVPPAVPPADPVEQGGGWS